MPLLKELPDLPVYITIKQLQANYNIGKGKAYEMIKRGQIKAVTLKEEGRTRGRVLIITESVEEYFRSLPLFTP